MVPISKSVGANRIYAAIAIPHPAGFPDLTPEEEFDARVDIVQKALEAATVDVEDQTVFGKN